MISLLFLFFFFPYVFPFCLAKSKRPGLTQPKLYHCPWASRFLAGCFWVFGEVTPTGRGFRWDLSCVMLRQNCMKCSLVINSLQQGSESPCFWVNTDFSVQPSSLWAICVTEILLTDCLKSTTWAQCWKGREMGGREGGVLLLPSFGVSLSSSELCCALVPTTTAQPGQPRENQVFWEKQSLQTCLSFYGIHF